MPVTAIPNTGSQLDRAICAYFVANNVLGGDVSKVFPSHTTKERAYPNVTVKSFQGQHDPVLSGNEAWQVQIQVKYSSTTAPNPSNLDANRAAMDATFGLVMALMLQTDDKNTLNSAASAITSAGRALKTNATTTPKTWASPENNQDMADFTVTQVLYKSRARGEPDDEANAWAEIATFEINACPSNVD